MQAGHPHTAVDGLIAADGSVRVPRDLAGPLRAVLGRWLAAAAADAGARPSPALRELWLALGTAERQPATRPSSADGTPPPGTPTMEISAVDAASLLGCSVEFARRLCRTGRIPARRIGRAGPWLIDQAGLDVWRHSTTRKAT